MGVDEVFRALADPTRRAMLSRLAQRERRIAAGMNRKPAVGRLPGAVLVRVDDVEACAIASRFDNERPEVDIGAEDVRAPGQNQARVLELLGLGEAPLHAVANREKKVPRGFITADGFGITAPCRRYLQPLIAGEAYPPYKDGLPDYVKIKGAPVRKKVKTDFKL